MVGEAQLRERNDYDRLGDALIDISNECGHVCNLQKTILIYGFTEFRQPHALRGDIYFGSGKEI